MEIDIPVKACPFCGGNDLALELATTNRLWVKCFGCTATAWLEDWNKRADDWVGVDDVQPCDAEQVIVYLAEGDIESFVWDAGYIEGWQITHWKPLPLPPEPSK